MICKVLRLSYQFFILGGLKVRRSPWNKDITFVRDIHLSQKCPGSLEIEYYRNSCLIGK